VDPQTTDPDAIGVAVTDGAVTLSGHVPTYVEKLAVARAAERVYRVKAVANEPSSVRLVDAPDHCPRTASRDPSRTSDVAPHRRQQSGDEANKRAREVYR
jgi:hypothetical protein